LRYALPQKDDKIQQRDLFELYKDDNNTKKKIEKLSQFDNLVLEFHSIEKRKSNKNRMYYFIDGKKLYAEFKRRHYILPEEDNGTMLEDESDGDEELPQEEEKKKKVRR
jgi:hypothetical protein